MKASSCEDEGSLLRSLGSVTGLWATGIITGDESAEPAVEDFLDLNLRPDFRIGLDLNELFLPEHLLFRLDEEKLGSSPCSILYSVSPQYHLLLCERCRLKPGGSLQLCIHATKYFWFGKFCAGSDIYGNKRNKYESLNYNLKQRV